MFADEKPPAESDLKRVSGRQEPLMPQADLHCMSGTVLGAPETWLAQACGWVGVTEAPEGQEVGAGWRPGSLGVTEWNLTWAVTVSFPPSHRTLQSWGVASWPTTVWESHPPSLAQAFLSLSPLHPTTGPV